MRILFQGDSITDAGRDRNDPHHLGNGYPKFAAELLREQYPQQTFEFLNFGISGNRTWDLLERWQTECLDWQPDIFSLMIGINDTWRRYDQGLETTAAEYEANVRSLLQQVRTQTKAKIVVLEPYFLPVNPAWCGWREDLNPKIDAVRRVARELADVYIPLDGMLNAACVGAAPADFSPDGVHPNECGAQLIADAYVKAVAPFLK